MFVSEFVLTLTEMFEGLQSDYVVLITPTDKTFFDERSLESFATKDLYSCTLTSSRGELKVTFADANNLELENILNL